MNFLAFVLIAGIGLITNVALGQTSPANPSPPSAASASVATGPGSSAPAGEVKPAPKPMRQVMISTLTDKDLKGLNETELGEIERVVENTTDKKTYVVVSRSGFLGLFEKEYLVPIEQIALSGDAVTTNLTQVQFESSAPFIDDTAKYRVLDDSQMVAVVEKR